MPDFILKGGTKANTDVSSKTIYLLHSRQDITDTDSLTKMQRTEILIIEGITVLIEDINSCLLWFCRVKIKYA